MIEPHILPIAIATLATSLALIAEHIALRQQPWRLQPPAAYVVGVLTILAGGLIWALLETEPVEPLLALLAFAIISMGGGAWVLLLYWWDARNERREHMQHIAGLKHDAKGLIREIRGTNEPRRDN